MPNTPIQIEPKWKRFSAYVLVAVNLLLPVALGGWIYVKKIATKQISAFHFDLPKGFYAVQPSEQEGLKDLFLRQGDIKAKAYGVGSTSQIQIEDFVAIRSENRLVTILLVVTRQPEELSEESIRGQNQERIDRGKRMGDLDAKSRVVTGITVANRHALLTEIYPSGKRAVARNYDIILPEKLKQRFQVYVMQDGHNEDLNVQSFLDSLRIKSR